MKLNPERQAPISNALVSAAGDYFGYEVDFWQELEGGIENTVISASLNNGTEKVQKHYNRDRKLAHVSLELMFLELAQEHAVPVPRYDRERGNSISVFSHSADNHEWYVVSMDKIAGIHPPECSGKWLQDLALTQAKIKELSEKT